MALINILLFHKLKQTFSKRFTSFDTSDPGRIRLLGVQHLWETHCMIYCVGIGCIRVQIHG